MRKITMPLILLLAALLIASSCSPTVSQQEYDKVSDELIIAQSQLASLQDKLAEAETLKTETEVLSKQYEAMKSDYEELSRAHEELSGAYEELTKQYDTTKSQYDNLQAKYLELSTEYEELSERYGAIMGETAEIINEEDVEQAIFELINLERRNNGIDELLWGKYLYKSAKANSVKMATNQQLEYSSRGSYQELYRATGYTSTKEMAKAVMTIWKDTSKYKYNFLNSVMVYGAVGVHKSGEVYYITFINDQYQ